MGNKIIILLLVRLVFLNFSEENLIGKSNSLFTKETNLKGLYHAFDQKISLILEQDKVYNIDKNNQFTTYWKYETCESCAEIVLLDKIKNSNNEKHLIFSCFSFALQIFDSNLNPKTDPVLYPSKDYHKTIIGKGVIDMIDNESIFFYHSVRTNDNKYKGIFEKYLYEIQEKKLTLIAHFEKIIAEENKVKDIISCKAMEEGQEILCALINAERTMKFGIIDKNFSDIQESKDINSPVSRLKMLRMNETLFCVIWFQDETNVEFFSIINKKYSSIGKISFSFLNIVEDIFGYIKDSSTIFLPEITDNKKCVVHILTLFEKNDIGEAKFTIYGLDFLQLTFTSFNPYGIGIVTKTINKEIISNLIFIPLCKNIFIELSSYKTKTFSVNDLVDDVGEDLKELFISLIKATENGTVINAENQIQISSVASGNIIVDYVLFAKEDIQVTSRVCRINAKISSDNSFCISCAFNSFPAEDNPSKCFEKDQTVPGYYFKKNKFVKCYDTCSTCSKGGDEKQNNCNSCSTKFIYIFDEKNHQCLCDKTKNRWYDNNGIAVCTDKCPEKFPLFNSETKECVQDLNNNFTLSSPGSQFNSLKSIFKNIDSFVKEYDLINSSWSIENSTFLMYNPENPELYLSNLKNISKINFGLCIDNLKKAYNLDSLLVLQIEIFRENQTSNQVEYKMYSAEKKTLNMSYCKDIEIVVKIPINKGRKNSINFETALFVNQEGYDIYNPKDEFYFDICTRFTSEFGTDVIIEDRKKHYYQKVLFCEKNCIFQGIDLKSEEVFCSCKVKQDINLFREFETNYIDESFSSTRHYMNLGVMKCISFVFEKEWLIKNLGFFLYLFLFMSEVILGLTFYFTGMKKFLQTINEIEKTVTKKKSSEQLHNSVSTLIQIKQNERTTSHFNLPSNPPKRDYEEETKNESKHTFPSIIHIQRKDNNSITKNSTETTGSTLVNNTVNISEIHHKYKSSKFATFNKKDDPTFLYRSSGFRGLETKNSRNLIVPSLDLNLNQSLPKVKETRSFKLKNEIRKLSYFSQSYLRKFHDYHEDFKAFCSGEDSKKKFFETYVSFLNEKQLIMFVLLSPHQEDLFIVKLSLFVIVVSFLVMFNGLWLTDSKISYFFYSKGHYSLMKYFSHIFISFIMTLVVLYFLKLLCLTHSKVDNINNAISKSKANKIKTQLIKQYQLKIWIFFSIGFFFTLLFWFYIATFCSIFSNSQRILFLNALIAFVILMIYPFFFCFFEAGLRILAIKWKSSRLFFISQIVHYF